MTIEPVTIANWQTPAMVRRSFLQIESFLATVPISRGAGAVAMWPEAPVPLADLPVPGHGTVRDVLDATETDAWVVVHDGTVVAEEYAVSMTASTRHLLMSVSKSIVGLVVGALVDRGVLDPVRLVTDYLPELKDSGYVGSRLRDVLDMRSGVRFSEDYLDPSSEVRQLDAAVGWAPPQGGPATLREFLRSTVSDRAPGGDFDYRSCETDVLGWVCEAAGGRPFAELASDLLWSRLGAESDASICVDAEGMGMFDGGITATARDLARFGATLLAGGVAPTGERVVSETWIADILAGDADVTAAFAASADAEHLPGGSYRSQCWVPAGGQHVLCIGIHGQLVYVDRSSGLVGVKLSSWPVPLDDDRMVSTLRMFDAVADHLRA